MFKGSHVATSMRIDLNDEIATIDSVTKTSDKKFRRRPKVLACDRANFGFIFRANDFS
ncbi:hypothetical protein BH11PSE11_BH11PSE11_29880 [soil metagenome]